jgi:hypothetical protein
MSSLSPRHSYISFPKPRPLIRFITAYVLTLSALAEGQGVSGWQTAEDDRRFVGRYAFVGAEQVRGFDEGELSVGCPASAPALPALVLRTDSELGSPAHRVYARVVGAAVTATHEWNVNGSQLELSGLDAALLLSEVVALPSPKAIFLRLEDAAAGPWSFPLVGIHEVLATLPCAAAFR